MSICTSSVLLKTTSSVVDVLSLDTASLSTLTKMTYVLSGRLEIDGDLFSAKLACMCWFKKAFMVVCILVTSAMLRFMTTQSTGWISIHFTRMFSFLPSPNVRVQLKVIIPTFFDLFL